MRINKIVQLWFLLHIAVLALAWVATNNLPERLTVSVQASSPTEYLPEFSRPLQFTRGESSSHLWIPLAYGDKDICFKKSVGSENPTFTSIVLDQRVCLRKVWSPADVCVSDDGSFVLGRGDAHWDMKRLVLLLGAIEVLILILTVIFAVLGRVMPQCGKKECIVDSAVVAMTVSAICVLIVPLQSYLSNASDFGFTFIGLLTELVPPFLLTTFVLFILLFWSSTLVRQLALVLAVSFAVYAYLGTGILSMDFPELNGDISFFRQVPRAIYDIIVLIVICIVLYLLSLKICRLPLFVSVVILLLASVSLLDIPKVERREIKTTIGRLVPKSKLAKEAFYSPRKNVLMFVLDQTSTRVMLDVLRQEPTFVQNLPGFVCYTNNIGMHNCTVLGVAGFMTGKYLEDPMKMSEYAHSIFSDDSFVTDYAKAGADVFFAPGSFDVGMTTSLTQGEGVVASHDVKSAVSRRIFGQQPWNVYEVARFRLVPFGLKFHFLTLSFYGWDVSQLASKESVLYPVLAQSPIHDECTCALQIWHTIGSHGPYDCSRYGAATVPTQIGYSPYFEQTWFVLSCVTNLLGDLRRKGVYDNSFIVITADHGSRLEEKNVKIRGSRLPVLMVKPEGGAGSLSFSNIPTSHSKIRNLFLAEIGRTLSVDDVGEILRTEQRLYRDTNASDFKDNWIDSALNVRVETYSSKKNSKINMPLRTDHKYSLYCSNAQDVPPIELEGVGYHSASGPLMLGSGDSDSPPARITFYAPKPKSHYLVVIEGRAGPDCELKMQCTGGGICLRPGGWSLQTLSASAVSDENGKVDVLIKLIGDGFAEVRSLQIKAENLD